MTKLRWVFGSTVLILLAANLASTLYTYHQTDDRLQSQQRMIASSAARTSERLARTVAASERTLTSRLDRTWRMIIVARKAACQAFTAVTPLPHYLYPSDCNLANMKPHSYDVRFWRQPTGWNTAN